MNYVIPILAIFITLSFLLKVGFYPRWGTWLTALCCALFVLLIAPWVTEQSKTAIAAFFASREKMLDVSVCITLEAAILITFCFDCFSGMRTRDTAFKRSVTFLLHLYPGLLIGVPSRWCWQRRTTRRRAAPPPLTSPMPSSTRW